MEGSGANAKTTVALDSPTPAAIEQMLVTLCLASTNWRLPTSSGALDRAGVRGTAAPSVGSALRRNVDSAEWLTLAIHQKGVPMALVASRLGPIAAMASALVPAEIATRLPPTPATAIERATFAFEIATWLHANDLNLAVSLDPLDVELAEQTALQQSIVLSWDAANSEVHLVPCLQTCDLPALGSWLRCVGVLARVGQVASKATGVTGLMVVGRAPISSSQLANLQVGGAIVIEPLQLSLLVGGVAWPLASQGEGAVVANDSPVTQFQANELVVACQLLPLTLLQLLELRRGSFFAVSAVAPNWRTLWLGGRQIAEGEAMTIDGASCVVLRRLATKG